MVVASLSLAVTATAAIDVATVLTNAQLVLQPSDLSLACEMQPVWAHACVVVASD